jgi:hypothetical protein
LHFTSFIAQQRQETEGGTEQGALRVQLSGDIQWRKDEGQASDHHDGQTSCQGEISRLSCDIQKLPAARSDRSLSM